MVDLNTLKEMMERAIKASRQAIDTGNTARAQDADSVLDRLNALAEQEASRRQAPQIVGPQQGPIADVLKNRVASLPAPQAQGIPVDSQEGAENRLKWAVGRLREIPVGGRDVQSEEVAGSLESRAPAATQDALQRLQESLQHKDDVTGFLDRNDPNQSEFFDVARRSIEDINKYGLRANVEKDRVSLPKPTGEANALQRRAKELGLPSAGSPQAPAAISASGPSGQAMNDLESGLLNPIEQKVASDPDIPQQEKDALARWRASIGDEPKLMTLENILMAFFFGAPTVLQKYGADVRHWKDSQADVYRAEFKSQLPSTSGASDEVARTRAEIARIRALGAESREAIKSQISTAEIELREVMEDPMLTVDQKKAEVKAIKEVIAKLHQQMTDVSNVSRKQLSGR